MCKNFVIMVILLSLVGASLECSRKGKEKRSRAAFPDSIVDTELLVTVNDYPLRGRDLRLFLFVYRPVSGDSIAGSEFYEELLEQLIDRTLLYQEAVANGVVVEDSTSRSVLMSFVRTIGGEEAFSRLLEANRINWEEFLQSVKRDLTIKQFLEQRFAREVRIREEDARDYFESHRNEFELPDTVRARQIFLRAAPGEDEKKHEEKRQLIDDILVKVKAGSDFAELARLYSEDPSGASGGDMGYFARGEMVEPFDSAVFELRVGEVSDVVETEFGYHIIKVEEKKQGLSLAFDTVRRDLMARMWEYELAGILRNHLLGMRQVAIIKRSY